MLAHRRIIVTGGAGFIGSHLVKALVEAENHVFVIDNLWRGTLDNLKRSDGSFVIDPHSDLCIADLTDYATCLEWIKNADYVYHLADVVAGIDYVFSHESYVFHQNVLINTNTLAACLSNNIPNYIYVGTACSFPKHLQMASGVARLVEAQTYPAEPESAYGWSKLMGEYEAELASRHGRINVGLLRLHNVYGPGADYTSTRSQVIPALCRKAIAHPEEDFVVWGSGNQYRDFVYVDDIVQALLLVAEVGMNQGVIQIGSEIPVTIRELAEKVIAVSGKAIELKFDTSRPEGDRGRVAVCDRARSILDWQPEWGLGEGIAATFAWVSAQMQHRVAREPASGLPPTRGGNRPLGYPAVQARSRGTSATGSLSSVP